MQWEQCWEMSSFWNWNALWNRCFSRKFVIKEEEQVFCTFIRGIWGEERNVTTQRKLFCTSQAIFCFLIVHISSLERGHLASWCVSLSFFKNVIYLFLYIGEKREKEREEISMCGCLSCGPHWGPGLHPRHVPWLGIKLATFWFAACAQSIELHQPVLNMFLINKRERVPIMVREARGKMWWWVVWALGLHKPGTTFWQLGIIEQGILQISVCWFWRLLLWVHEPLEPDVFLNSE